MPEPHSIVAAFLDRDGTLIEDRDYTNDPAHVVLRPGAVDGVRRLASAGFPSIVVTNQSGIARGLVSLTQYHAVKQRLDDLLRNEGVELRDTFACPHHPDFTGPCGCRKPETGLYERAAAAYDLDLSRCFYIGDRMRDIKPAQSFDGYAALVRSPATGEEDLDYARAVGVHIVEDLAAAVALLVAEAS